MMHVFKPLRNYLRGLNQEAVLSSIYYLSNHLEWDVDLPTHLVQANPYNKHKMRLGFYLWSLDTLSREVILSADDRHGSRGIDWRVCAKALRLLHNAEEAASRSIDDRTVFSEMNRIGHRQFHWQQDFSFDDLARYMRIYGQPDMREVIEAEYKLTIEQLFQGGFALLATFLSHEALAPGFPAQASKMLGFNVAPLIERFTTTVEELRPLVQAEQSLDRDWAYTFNPLRTYPLLKMPSGITRCPMTGMLSRRFTDGMYYEIGKIPDALSRHLGPAYQAYVGEVLTRSSAGNFTLTAEMPYGTAKKPKDTVDWIVEDQSGSLFLECKVLRLGKLARSKMAPAPETEREYKKLAKAIAQIYQTLKDALDGQYPNWSLSSTPVYPIIVTMDDWNLFTSFTQGIVNDLARDEMTRRGVDPAFLNSHPYKLCHIREFEQAIQVMSHASISKVMSGIHSKERLGWQMSGYLNTDFPEEIKLSKSLFPEDRKLIMPPAFRSMNYL
jgi:hypothetical protein